MTLYRKLIRPMHCYPGHNYEPLTEPVEKEEKWYPEEEREHLEEKYGYLNEGHFSDLIFEEKYEPCLLKEQAKTKVVFGRTKDGEFVTECENCGTYLDKAYSNCPKCKKELDWNSNQT